MTKHEIKELIGKMTLEEKASLCSGKDFWHTKSVERLGVPSFMVADGPNGLRKQNLNADHLGVNESIKAVCFPTGCGMAASFNRDLAKLLGETVGNECQAENVSILLGPSANIKRSPLCGRNFEYLSEDPIVATEMAGAFIDGVQSKNVGTSIKHFLGNNQELRRMSYSAEIDERTLNEIYLAAFEGAIKEHKPWTVMSSYNRINGTYVGQSHQYLTEVLRDKWGFDGMVVSDWGAIDNRVEDIKAGLDLEMPSSFGITDKQLVEAVRNGSLLETDIDLAVERILSILYKFLNNRDEKAQFDLEKDHEISRKIAEETVVLLKNDNILPLEKTAKVAFIGKYAKNPRYQGGGSSHINSAKKTSAWDCAKELENAIFAQGYNDKEDVIEDNLIQEAVKAASEVEVAVIFAGLPDSFESEGFDRTHMRLPNCQNALITQVLKVQPNTIVVLHNGSPVEMPWVNDVKGIVEAYLGGEAIGGAVYDILYGNVNPSGKLAETFPIKLEDNPSYLFYFGEKDVVEYREGIFVGYRYYDKKKMNVLFPFGHGLSYTTFAYSNLKVSADNIKDTDTLTVSIDVTNTGKVAGKEAVQLYVSDKESTVIRPEKELKDFGKVDLQPGETKTVTFTLGKRAFAYYSTKINDWHVESGEFDILIGQSSKNIVASKTVYVASTVKLPVQYTINTVLRDIMEDEEATRIIEPILEKFMYIEEEETEVASEAVSMEMKQAMLQNFPLRGVYSFGQEAITPEELQEIVDQLNRLHKQ